jgi:hypothetical protein
MDDPGTDTDLKNLQTFDGLAFDAYFSDFNGAVDAKVGFDAFPSSAPT